LGCGRRFGSGLRRAPPPQCGHRHWTGSAGARCWRGHRGTGPHRRSERGAAPGRGPCRAGTASHADRQHPSEHRQSTL